MLNFSFKIWPFVTFPIPEVYVEIQQINELIKLIKSGGLVAIIGDVGIGKSTTLLKLNQVLSNRDVKPILIKSFKISIHDFLIKIAQECEVKVKQFSTYQIIDQILENCKSGKPIIMIDDFDYLNQEVQEFVKVIHDYGIPIVITCKNLENIDYSIKSRVEVEVKLRSFNLDEAKQLLEKRWIWAIGDLKSFPFTNDEIKLIYEKSNGIPRQILVEASKLLLNKLGIKFEVKVEHKIEHKPEVRIKEKIKIEDSKLTPLQEKVIEVLKKFNKPMRPNEIATIVGSTEASIRNVLKKLEEKKLVKRIYIGKYVHYIIS